MHFRQRILIITLNVYDLRYFKKVKPKINLHVQMPFQILILITKNVKIGQSFSLSFGHAMDKRQLTERNLGRVFNFRSGHLHAAQFWGYL